MDMTPEEIRDCAVHAVEEFINNKVPLSQAVACCAETHALNSEQVKRVIEAANSIAYLKLLGGAEDRTFEFPVAEYTEVMGHLALPKNKLILNTSDPKEPNIPMEESINKDDIGMFPKAASEYSKEENELFLMRAWIRNRADLEKIANRRETVKLEIEDSLLKLQADKFGIEKLAEVAEESMFKILAPFFGLDKKAEEDVVFLDKSLNEARRLIGLCKEAQILIKEEIEKQALDQRALEILKEAGRLGKTVGAFSSNVAGLPAHAAGAAGKAMGAAAVAAPAFAAKGLGSYAKHVGGWGLFNRVVAVSGASSYKPKNEDVWKALHG